MESMESFNAKNLTSDKTRHYLIDSFLFLARSRADDLPGCLAYREQHCGCEGLYLDYPVLPGAELILCRHSHAASRLHHAPMPDVLQLNLCLKGRMEWQLCTQDRIYLSPGDMSVHRMDACCPSSQSFSSGQYEGILLLLHVPLLYRGLPADLEAAGMCLQQLLRNFGDGGQPYVFPAAPASESLFAMLEYIPDACRPAYFRLKLQELLLYLSLQENLGQSPAGSTYPPETVRIIQEIHARLVSNLRERITIENLSREFLINTSTLKTAFKALYGSPIAQYMRAYRIHYAAGLLIKTEMTAGEIADEVGYESQSKFTAAFKAVMQISPTEYRERYRRQP